MPHSLVVHLFLCRLAFTVQQSVKDLLLPFRADGMPVMRPSDVN